MDSHGEGSKGMNPQKNLGAADNNSSATRQRQGQQQQQWADASHWERDQPMQSSPLTGYGRGDLYNAGYDEAVDGSHSNQHEWKARTESEIMTDQLHRQGQYFPPPPPPICPPDTRRQRAELWSRSATQWDITRTIAPPPRCPLDGMDQEHHRGLQSYSLVPYKGDQWLQQSEHWFGFVQKNFKYPPDNQPSLSSFSFVSQCCRVDDSKE